MKIKLNGSVLHPKDSVFVIKFKKPSKEELEEIRIYGPDIEGQTSCMETYIDRQLDDLKDMLNNCTYTLKLKKRWR